MGQDDGNEGLASDECPEHLWRLTCVTLAREGAYTAYECARCGGLLVVPPHGVRPGTI